MKKAISTNLHIPLPSAPAPPKIEPNIDEPSSSCSTALTSPISLANLQGICVYQLPFPGVLSEKDQREKLSAIIKKYTRNFEIRFDAVPNNSVETTQQTGNRRFQPLPLIRRALIVIQKLANCETLQNELNRLSMVGCQLKASAATTEDLTTFICARTAKPSPLLASKPTSAPPPLQSNSAEFQTKRPQNLLRLPIISPPAAAVKAMIFDSQNHIPDPFSKNASRTLYIKHLDTNINEEELKTRYSKFGHILDIEVKNRNTMAPYAFIQFTNIESVSNAIKQSNQQQLEDINRQKKNSTHHWWGNTLVSNRLWVGLLPSNCGEQYLASKVRVVLTSPEHDITKVDYDPAFNEAVLIFTGHEAAHFVFNKIKTGQIKFQPESSTSGAAHHNNFVHVDFCSEKLHSYFVDRLFHKTIDLNSGILPSPPEQPKLLALHSLKKTSPSPPPDPSTESTEKILSTTDRSEVHNHPNNQQRIDPSILSADNIGNRQTREKEMRRHNKNKLQNESIKKKQQKTETMRILGSSRRSRSSSTSSESSIDTYTAPKRSWRDHSQQKASKEIPSREPSNPHSNIHRHQRRKQWKNQPTESQYSKGHKHQGSEIEKTKHGEERNRNKEGRGRRLKKHESSSRKVDITGERNCRDRSRKRETGKKSSGSKGDYHRKTRSKSDARQSSSILPPPPQPPTQMGRIVNILPKAPARDKSSSSCSSLTSDSSGSSYSGSESCSTCIFNEDAPRREHNKKESSESDSSTSLSEYSNENGGKNTMHLETISVSENEEKDKIVQMPIIPAKISNEDVMEGQIEHEHSDKEYQTSKPQNLIQKEEKTEALMMQRTESINSEIVYKKSEQNILSNSTSKCDLTARLRTLLRSSHISIPLTKAEAIVLNDPRKQNEREEQKISLELPRFALKLKLPKRGRDHQNFNENKLTIELKQPKKEESYEDPIIVGTPISATPTCMLQKQEILLEISDENGKQPNDDIYEENETNETSIGKEHRPSISSFIKADSILKEIYEKIGDRRANLELEKVPKKNETNILKIQKELDQVLAVFSGTSIHELPILLDRFTTSHRQQQQQNVESFRKSELDSELKMELDENQEELIRPRVIGPSFSFEQSDKHNEEKGNLTIDSYERRYTLPSNAAEMDAPSSSSTKTKNLISRPRASSSSTSQTSQQQSHELGSPKMESPNLPHRTSCVLFAKPKSEKEDTNQLEGSSLSKSLAVKKNPATILKKQISNQTEMDSNKQSPNANNALKITQHQQKFGEQRKSSTPSSLISKTIIKKNDGEKDLVKKEHKDKGMNKAKQTEIKALSTFKKISSIKEEKRKESAEPPKKSFSVGSKEQMKSTILKQKGEDEFHSEEKYQKRKNKRKHETSSSEEEDEDDETIAGLFDIELEEQKKILEEIKSGKTDGLSMYDRVKRRSSQRPEDEKKKANVLEQLREKQAKKKKELNRVRLLSTSSDSDGSKESTALTSSSIMNSGNILNRRDLAIKRTDHSEFDEDIEVDVDVDDSFSHSSMAKTEEILVNIEEAKPSISTIKKPEIAPKKPMPTEEIGGIGNEDSEAKNFSSSGEWNLSVSSDGDEMVEGSSKIGDKVLKKLKMEFDRHRPSSQSSFEGGKGDFDQKLARVIDIAKEGINVQQQTDNSEDVSTSDERSNSSSSDEENRQTTSKGIPIFKKRTHKKGVTNLSLEDVFGEDSDEYESTFDENAEKSEPLVKSPNISIQPAKNKEKAKTPTLKAKKLTEIKLAKNAAEEKQTIDKNKKSTENLRQKSASIGKESGKHLTDLKRLKRQSPIRSISIEDLHATTKQENKEKQKSKVTNEKNLGQTISTKKPKNSTELSKQSFKGIKRQQNEEEEGGKFVKRSKLEISKSTTKLHEKEQKHKQPKSPNKAVTKQEKEIKENINKKAEGKKAVSPLKELKRDEEMDAFGLLKIVDPVAADEFEVIDSGKVSCGNEKVDDKIEMEIAGKKEEDRKREEEQAELLRKMEQNEEEEAVAALKLQTTITKRNSQDAEDGQSNLSSFIKPVEHNCWPKNVEDVNEPEIADNDEEMKGENKMESTEKNDKIEHEAIERRPSNESLDAQMLGSGFVEIDAEVLKEQQEMEILAEEKRKLEEAEQRKAEEAKRLEATVDFVASSKAAEETSNISQMPMQQSQLFGSSQNESIARVQQEKIIDSATERSKNPSVKQFIMESSLQQPQTHQERIGVIVSEAQIQQTAALGMGTHQQSNQMHASNIFVNLQSDQQKTTNQYMATAQQQSMNAISEAQMSRKMSSYEAAYSIPTTTLMPNPPFMPSTFEQHQSKIFIPQLGTAGDNSQQKHVESKLPQSMHQPQMAKKMQQIGQANWQTPQQHPPPSYSTQSIPALQSNYQPKEIQTQMPQIRIQQPAPIIQTSQQSKHQDLRNSQEQLKQQQRPQSIMPQIHQTQMQHPVQTADQFANAATTAAVASSGLMDSSQFMQFYQRLMLSGGDQQQSQILQQSQQIPHNLSNSMMAVTASNSPAALAKWHALFSSPTTSAAISTSQAAMNCSGIEDLLRQSALLGHSSMGIPPPTSQSGMTPASIEELYQQYMPTAPPHLHQQQQTIPLQTSLANNQQQQLEHLQRHNQPMQRTQIPPIVCSSNPPQNVPLQSQNMPTPYQKPQPSIQQPIIEQPRKMPRQNAAATLWQGQLAMKNSDTLIQMHKVCGNEQLMDRMNAELVSQNEQGVPLLRITQRMRLEQSQLENVLRKMEVEGNYLSLICFPCGRDRNDVTVQMEKMRKAFIEYFLQKAAAGIASSPPNSCIAHIFAPDHFIKSLLAKNAPDILRKVELCNAGYLFVILTNS